MIEPSHDQFSDKKLLFPHAESSFKLPRIDNPQSRGAVKSRAENRNLANLPSIRLDLVIKPPAFAPRSLTPRKNISNDLEKEDFAIQIEQKLKLVLDNVNQGRMSPVQLEDTDQFDFQAIINQNKEILKLNKVKNDSRVDQKQSQVEVEKKHPPKSKSKKYEHRNESLYEKRLKDYRENSVQNKYIHKKKQLLKHQAEKSKPKAKEEAMFVKPSQVQPSRNGPKSRHNEKRVEKVVDYHKSENVFDNIQNFLQNPSKSQISPTKLKQFSNASLKQLEEKLRIVNKKLGIEGQASKEEVQELEEIQRATAKDWRRMEIKGKASIHRIDSNFDKEADRVLLMQEKNNECLSQCIEQQKFLMELVMLKKIIATSEKNQLKSN